MEWRSVALDAKSSSEDSGVRDGCWLFLNDDKNGDGGIDTGVSDGFGGGSSNPWGEVEGAEDTGKEVGGAVWGVTSGAGGPGSGGDSEAIVSGIFLPSSLPSPSSSASLEESELSDSSFMASLTLSRISTLARAEATGRARLPRMTAYRRFARSLSRLIRSKCLAIFETLPLGGLRNVDLPPPLLEVRGGILSFADTRLFDFDFPTLLEAVDPEAALLGSGADSSNLTSPFILLVDVRFSGEGCLEGSRDSNDDPITGPGIRLL